MLLPIMFLLLFSCKKDEDLKLYTQRIREFYDATESNLNPNVKGILVVQLNGGCSGCTGTGLSFIKENYNSPNANFIVSNWGSKMIKLKLGNEKLFMSSQILKDGQQIAVKLGLINTFPVIYYLKNGIVVEKIILDAENIYEELAEFKLRITRDIK
ncbi:hypothetical protein [Thermoflexibacter ruber]|uniref:Uncharacterized protein n=1 Tax=Thermoflexibacter ruber TaxID=1003 RepID=A0A1I2FWE5_9BACT|nr:hypothetical protein [Thermoflexibacter ruber]SFF09263.1 hypothetical protein SAMN04488541_101590 [Thermoflexibacter ruber]